MSRTRSNPALREDFKPLVPWNENSDKKALIFYHIPKCAGTSMNAMLAENFDQRLRVHGFNDWKTLHDAIEKSGFNDAPLLLFGHQTFGVHELFTDRACYYLTVLRDPVERILSHYRQERKRRFEDFSLEEFVEKRIHLNQVHLIGGGSFDLAKKRLTSCFDAFGLVEKLEDSLRWFQKRYKLKNMNISQLNKTKGNDDESDSHRRAHDIFARLNPEELEFYDFAVEEFERRRQSDEPQNPPSDFPPQPKPLPSHHHDNSPSTGNVKFFDPFKNVQTQVEDHDARGEYQLAIDLLESLEENVPFRSDRLADMCEKAGNLERALYWAAKSRNDDVTHFLRYYRLKTIINNDNSLKTRLLINKIKEFRAIPSRCPDSSLNNSLHILCEWLVKAARFNLTSRRIPQTPENVFVEIAQSLPKDDHSHKDFWDKIDIMLADTIKNLDLSS